MTIARLIEGRAAAIVTCNGEARVGDAIALLAERRIGAMPVIRNGEVSGIFSERDVVYRLHEHGPAVLDRPVSEVMTSPAVTVEPSTAVLTALSLMTRRRIRHLPSWRAAGWWTSSPSAISSSSGSSTSNRKRGSSGPIFRVSDGARQRLAPRGQGPYIDAMDPASLNLSPAAAARVALIATKQGKPPILRLAVEGGGCSGFQYRFDLAETAEAGDLTSETDGVKLVVDPMSLELVAGCTVDYVESLGGAAFRVENPNASAGCGCGSSFAV